MAVCSYCGSRILFGGIESEGSRFCNAACQERRKIVDHASDLPQDALDNHIKSTDETAMHGRLRIMFCIGGGIAGWILAAYASSFLGRALTMADCAIGVGLCGGIGCLMANGLIALLSHRK